MNAVKLHIKVGLKNNVSQSSKDRPNYEATPGILRPVHGSQLVERQL